MSVNITTAFVQHYSTNVAMLLQQEGSRLREAVQQYSFTGKAASVVEQFGSIAAIRNQGRHSDTPLLDLPQDRRWVYPYDFDTGYLLDQQDMLRLTIDPAGPVTKACANAMGRAIDDEIISGFFNSNNTGENGTTATGLLSAFNSGSQVVAATEGASGNTGMNIAKLRKAKFKLMKAQVDVDRDQLYVILSAKQHDDLLNETQAINSDYNGSKPTLVEGRITSFMGFNFLLSEQIPGAEFFNVARNPALTGYTTESQWLVPYFAKSGVAMGLWNDITTTVDRRVDKRNAWQIYSTATFGATRTEEKRCGYIVCT